MIIVAHRRNTIAELTDTPAAYGVEVDIRSSGDELIINHDPFAGGSPFEAWIAAYRHALLILNVKEEGLENRLLALMDQYGVDKFFFLDQSFPFLIKTARAGERRCAVRVSEYESIDTALSLAGTIEWVWVDCFTRFALSSDEAAALGAAGFKLCLVSPELQGRDAEAEIPDLRRTLELRAIRPAAVCTKRPDLWR